MLQLARRLARSAAAFTPTSVSAAVCGRGLATAAGSGGGRSEARALWRGTRAPASISRSAAWEVLQRRLGGAAAAGATWEVRALKAESEARAVKAEAEALAAKAQAAARAAKANARAAKAEVRAVKAEAVRGDLTSKLKMTHRDLAEARSQGLLLTNMRNLREFASDLITRDLTVAQVAVPPGVQNALNAAAATKGQHLHGALHALAVRHSQRARDVRSCLAGLYHTLSKGMHHGSGDDVLVRETDFAAPAERLAVCAVLEAYDVPYTYVLASGKRAPVSPYALQPDERARLVPVPPDDT